LTAGTASRGADNEADASICNWPRSYSSGMSALCGLYTTHDEKPNASKKGITRRIEFNFFMARQFKLCCKYTKFFSIIKRTAEFEKIVALCVTGLWEKVRNFAKSNKTHRHYY
jgi:hypothetical protein